MFWFFEYGVIFFFPLPCSPDDYVDSRSALPPDLEKPDCAKVFELPYSIHAFQHLRVSRGQTCQWFVFITEKDGNESR